MAGVEFCKYKKGAIGDAGFDAHFDNGLRADPRVRHANVHIDVAKTRLNYCIGTSGWCETRRRIGARMEGADAAHPPQRIRADRVGFYSLNVRCPPELEDTGEEAEFFQKAYETACEVMPSVEGAFVHKDEKHEYRNADTKEMAMSRYEMHVFGAAITGDGRLNGKQAISPGKCKEINDKMQAMCLREFGISYQTGEGRKGRKKRTVEQAEAMGVVRELADKVQYANDTVETLRLFEDDRRATLASLDAQIAAKRKEAEAYKPYTEAMERLHEAIQHLLGQIMALKPGEREREKDLFAAIERYGREHGPFGRKSPEEINRAAGFFERESSRIESENPAGPDDDFGMR